MPAEPDSRVRLVTGLAEEHMDVDRDEYVGMSTGKSTITVERGPVTQFAASVTDTNPIYRNREVAQAAGLLDIPVRPTYFFSGATFWGSSPEDQPDDATPARKTMAEVMG